MHVRALHFATIEPCPLVPRVTQCIIMPALIIFSLSLSETIKHTHTHKHTICQLALHTIHGLKSSCTIIVTRVHKHPYQPQKNTQLTWIYTTVSNCAGPLAADRKGKHGHSWTSISLRTFITTTLHPALHPPQTPDRKTGQDVLTLQVKCVFCSERMETLLWCCGGQVSSGVFCGDVSSRTWKLNFIDKAADGGQHRGTCLVATARQQNIPLCRLSVSVGIFVDSQ